MIDVLLCVQVLQDLLDILHDHANQIHAARLEIIVIWLIGEQPPLTDRHCASMNGCSRRVAEGALCPKTDIPSTLKLTN